MATMELSGRNLTAAYSCALALIAALSLGSHLTLRRVLAEHEGSATVINVAGRQRMLSQRIAGLAAERQLGLPVEADLVQAIDQFERAHHALLVGDTALDLVPATDPALRTIYFSGSAPLDGAVTDFVARARRILALPPGDAEGRTEAAALFAEAREPILSKLNAVVGVHQAASERQLGRLEWLQTASLVVVFATLAIEALLIFRPMVRRIARYTQTLLVMAATDPLTGALNRRSWTERAKAELGRAQRYGRPSTLLAIDADRFKTINDRYGHAGGDAVLKAFVQTVGACLRPSDLLGRIGGEEFVVLLAETDVAGAEVAAERIRQAIADLEIESASDRIRFTISVGVAAFGEGRDALEDALERADVAVYAAKDLGRNRVVVGTSPRAPDDGASPMGLAVA